MKDRPDRLRWAVVAAFAAWMFLGMGVYAAGNDTMPGDLWLTRQLQSLDSVLLRVMLDTTSGMATIPYLAVAAGLASVALLFLAGPAPALSVSLAVAVRSAVPLFKELFERPRPDAALVEVQSQLGDYSFPSGHAFNAVLIYGLIYYFAGRYVRPLCARRAVQWPCVWIMVLTPLQRVYAGAHWPSDVLGGVLLAGVLLVTIVGLHKLAPGPAFRPVLPRPLPPRLASPGGGG